MMGTLFSKYGFVVAMLCVGGLIYFSYWVAKKFLRNKIPGSAIAIFIGLILAYIGGVFTGGKNGIADVKIFSGFALLGGAMFRDFTIVSTAMGADFEKLKIWYCRFYFIDRGIVCFVHHWFYPCLFPGLP